METVYIFRTRRFALELATEPELSFNWLGSGEDALVCFCARVRVLLDGRELASDYLAGCWYDSIEAFRQDSYFYDMVRSAIKDARAAIRNTPRLRAA